MNNEESGASKAPSPVGFLHHLPKLVIPAVEEIRIINSGCSDYVIERPQTAQAQLKKQGFNPDEQDQLFDQIRFDYADLSTVVTSRSASPRVLEILHRNVRMLLLINAGAPDLTRSMDRVVLDNPDMQTPALQAALAEHHSK